MANLDELDKKLIEEREKYEEEYYGQIIDEMIKEESLDKLIADRFEYIDNSFEFEPSPAYEHLEELYCVEYDSKFQEQIRDVDDYIDYPEGPNENLNGIMYDEHYEEIEYDLELDAEMEKAISQQIDEDIPLDFYEQLVDDAFIDYEDDEEKYFEHLIKQHLEEEKEFLDNILVDVIYEENYFEKAIDELIFEQIDLDYEPNLFDYEDNNKIENNTELSGKYEVELIFKNYFTKDDKLDKIIKQKIKKEKF